MKSALVRRTFVVPGQHSDILGMSGLKKRPPNPIPFAVPSARVDPVEWPSGIGTGAPNRAK